MVSLRRPHYAWIICLGGALSLFAVMGMGINVFSVYQPYIIQLNGFSNAQGSWDHHHAQPLHPGRHADSESAVRPDRLSLV